MNSKRRLLEVASDRSKRGKEIMWAIFDYYIRKRFVDGANFYQAEEIGITELRVFALSTKCDKESLSLAIKASYERMKGLSFANQPTKDEARAIKAVIKFHVNGLKNPLSSYRRDFGNMTTEINHFRPSLTLKTQELIDFAYPIYREVFEEIFRVNKVMSVPLEATEG